MKHVTPLIISDTFIILTLKCVFHLVDAVIEATPHIQSGNDILQGIITKRIARNLVQNDIHRRT